MVQRIYKQQELKLAFFFNSDRGLKSLNFLGKKLNIKCIFLAKKNLDKKILKQINNKYLIIDSLKNPIIKKKLKKEKINLIISAGFPYIFGKNFFLKKKIDILNLHGGPVPRYRGGSPLVWQKIEGKKNIGISVLRINQSIDGGELLGVEYFKIGEKENIKNIKIKSEKIFYKLLWDVIQKYYLNKDIKLNIKQSFPAKYYFQRSAHDSLITPKIMNSKRIIDFHKALVPSYENPFLYYGENKVFLKKIKNTKIKSNNVLGYVEKLNSEYFLNLKDKKIRIEKTSIDLKKIQNKILSSEKLSRDIWLERIFNKKCYKSCNESFIKLFKNYENSFIFLKTRKPIDKEYFLDRNLKYIDRNITFQKKIRTNSKYIKHKDISYKSTLTNNEKNKVIKITYKNFKTSQFHLDERLSEEKSDLIKKQLIIDHFLGTRSEKIFVQFYKKKISGFCLIKFEGDNIARVELICVDKKFAKKGLAKDLTKYSLFKLKKMNKKELIVSVEEKNILAVKLYKSLKFFQKKIFYLYHYIS